MKKFLTSIFLLSNLITLPFSMAAKNQIEPDAKQFSMLPAETADNPYAKARLKKDKIVVTEFFSYGCPACNYVSDDLRDWASKLPNDVVFNRVPVAFFRGWDELARAYYVAEDLKVLDKLDHDIFKAIHVEKKDLTKKAALKDFFVNNGLQEKEFDKSYDSFAVNRSLERGKMLMQTYKIYAVPTIVVGNSYATDLQKAGGKADLIKVLDKLVAKERQDSTIANKKNSQANSSRTST